MKTTTMSIKKPAKYLPEIAVGFWLTCAILYFSYGIKHLDLSREPLLTAATPIMPAPDRMTANSPALDAKQTGEVLQIEGIYVFTDSRPLASYIYQGTVFNKGTFGVVSQYTDIRDFLLKKVKKEFPQADGIIFYFNPGGTDKADAIKFDKQ